MNAPGYIFLKCARYLSLTESNVSKSMEYISTSALANELDVKSNELFDKLKTLGWIDKRNQKWELTDLGKQKGGQTRTSPKFGEIGRAHV